MKDLKTFEFGADSETLTRAYESGSIPANLEPIFRAMVSEVASAVGAGSGSVYICSPEADAEPRNRFAFLVAKLVRAHVPTALLVDKDRVPLLWKRADDPHLEAAVLDVLPKR